MCFRVCFKENYNCINILDFKRKKEEKKQLVSTTTIGTFSLILLHSGGNSESSVTPSGTIWYPSLVRCLALYQTILDILFFYINNSEIYTHK